MGSQGEPAAAGWIGVLGFMGEVDPLEVEEVLTRRVAMRRVEMVVKARCLSRRRCWRRVMDRC